MDRSAHRPAAVVEIDGRLTLARAVAVAEGRAHPHLPEATLRAIAAGHQRLQAAITEQRLIYGVTTGFGPLANRRVATEDAAQLQRNLIYHLATGVGDFADWATARLIVLARLASICRGASGASPRTAAALSALLLGPAAPLIPLKGTVGASGDLTPLAHMALAFMGEGGFVDRTGEALDAGGVLAEIGGPLALSARDGLALVNGTSAMTGVATLNAVRAARLTALAEVLGVGVAELLGGRAEAWDPVLAVLRPHPGQVATTARLARLAAGSERLKTGKASEIRLAAGPSQGVDEPMQDAYTLRCIPQVIGAVRDVLDEHARVVEIELNAATDNPLFPNGAAPVHGGNFMGQQVAFASDSLKAAMIALTGLAERQVARVTDERLNRGLPAFLHRGAPGLHSGLMGAQVTASAVLAEMRSRAAPAAAQSISTNAANQDVVSLGTIAARSARDALDDCATVLAILGLAVAQGIDCSGGTTGFAPATQELYRAVRAESPALDADRPLSRDIMALATAMRDGRLAVGPAQEVCG
ncbi:MAG: histidine ammonia-lyase [Pikeienuella sp.]